MLFWIIFGSVFVIFFVWIYFWIKRIEKIENEIMDKK